MAKIIDKKKVIAYTVELTQKEVDLIKAVTGCIVGDGEVREVSSGIWRTLGEFTDYDYNDLFLISNVKTREDFTFG